MKFHDLPQNPQAEKAIIGCILLDPSAMGLVCDIIGPEDFYSDNLGLIYQACLGLYRQGRPVDLVSVVDILRTAGNLQRIGGEARISSLLDHVATSANVQHWADIVKEKAVRRKAIQLCHITSEAAQQQEDFDAFIAETQASFLSLSSTSRAALIPGHDAINQAFDSLGQEQVLPTGLQYLDSLLGGGLRRDEFIIVGGRSGSGKTALAIQVMLHCALQEHRHCLFFSLEMSANSIMQRVICARAGVDLSAIRAGHISVDRQWSRLSDAAGQLWTNNFYITDAQKLTMQNIFTTAQQYRNTRPLDLIILDHIGYIRPDQRQESRERELAACSMGLKDLAKRMGCPVVAVCPINRQAEGRSDPRPRMGDLKGSSDLEYNTDIIVLLHRDLEKLPEKLEVYVCKNRQGRTGALSLHYDLEHQTFASWSND